LVAVDQLSPANRTTLLLAHAAIVGAAHDGEWTALAAKHMAEVILRKQLKVSTAYPGMRIQDVARTFLRSTVTTEPPEVATEPPEVTRERRALVARMEAARLPLPAKSVHIALYTSRMFTIIENAVLPKSAANVPPGLLDELMNHRGGTLLRLQSTADTSVFRFFRWYDRAQGDVVELGSEAFAMFSSIRDPHTGSNRRSSLIVLKVFENLAPVTNIVFSALGTPDHEAIESWIHDRPAVYMGEPLWPTVTIKAVYADGRAVAAAALPVDDMVPYEIVSEDPVPVKQCIQCGFYVANAREQHRPAWAFCGSDCQTMAYTRLHSL
jgi:hypothetical protein